MDFSLQEMQQRFEYELKRKLSERAKRSSREMRVLLNGFRFFDTNYSGVITKDQWIQGVLRTGLTGFSENELNSIFILYDKNNTGKIDYKNFCNFLYGREPLNPQSNNNTNNNEQSLEINQELSNEKINTQNMQIQENNEQINNMNMYMNRDNNYNKQNNRNYINNSTNNRMYNENNNNFRRETPYYNNNYNNINQYNNINNNQRNRFNYNNNQNDNFGENIRTPMNMSEYQGNNNFRRSQRKVNSYSNTFNNIFQQEPIPSNIKNNKLNNYNLSESAINSIIVSIRNNINKANGVKLYTFIKNLKMRELNNLLISLNDLYSIFQEMRINIPYDELKIFFNFANKNESDIISSKKLMNIIKGNLSEQRKLYIERVFSNIDTEQTGKISIQLLKNIFNAKNHPEVINGTKSEEEVYEQFCYSLDLYCEINDIQKNGELTFANFLDYYSGVSASIPDEVYFEDMINGVWSDNNNKNNNLNYNNNNSFNINQNKQNEISNNEQKEDYNTTNRFNNSFKYNNISNNLNNINNNIIQNNNYEEKRIKNSMSSPYFYDVNNIKNNQQNNNTNYNNNNPSGFSNYSNNRFSNNITNFNKSPITPEVNRINPNKRRYNPILDEYYPEIPIRNNNSNNNDINNNKYNIISGVNNQSENTINTKNNLINVENDINKNNLIESLRNSIISRGPKSIFAFQRMLTIFDRNRTGEISLEDFINIFQTYNLNFSEEDIKNIFVQFQPNQSGLINYSLLINNLIGNLSEKNISLIKNVFNSFNLNEKNEVSLKEIKQRYKAGGHPDVINGKKNMNEVYGEFLDILEIFREYIDNLKGGFSQNINFQEFKQFYTEINMSIKDDYIFENMIVNCWNLNRNKNNSNNNNINYNMNNEYNNYNYGYDRNIRARTGQQIMNMNNKGY